MFFNLFLFVLRFDQEMHAIRDELEQEKSLHETSQRERDKYSSEKYSIQNSLNEKADENIQLKRKIERLNEEIDEYSSSGKSDIEVCKSFMFCFKGIILTLVILISLAWYVDIWFIAH